MAYVVFSEMGPKAGLWDDLALVVCALAFVWAFVRLLRDRAMETAQQARRSEGQSPDGSRNSRWPGMG